MPYCEKCGNEIDEETTFARAGSDGSHPLQKIKSQVCGFARAKHPSHITLPIIPRRVRELMRALRRHILF